MKFEMHDTPLGRFIVPVESEFDDPDDYLDPRIEPGPAVPAARALGASLGRLLDRFRPEPDPTVTVARREARATIDQLDAAFSQLLDNHVGQLRQAAPPRAPHATPDPDPEVAPAIDADFHVIESHEQETAND